MMSSKLENMQSMQKSVTSRGYVRLTGYLERFARMGEMRQMQSAHSTLSLAMQNQVQKEHPAWTCLRCGATIC